MSGPKTPLVMGILKGTIIPPDGGWMPNTWYLVKVAMSSTNPIHHQLFFSGFLDSEGAPAGYSGGMAINYAPQNRERATRLNFYYYLEVVTPLIDTKGDIWITAEFLDRFYDRIKI